LSPAGARSGDLAVPDIAVYVHWPYCARICPYCDFNVVRDRGQAEQADLARAIVRDLEGQAARIGPRRLVSIFFGGGTPSLMDPTWTAAIIKAARRLWPAAPDLEVSLEANPTDAEADRFAAFAAAGVGRLSLGLQSLDDEALRFLGRNHGAAEARRAAMLAGRLFPRLSIDMIYARPGQTPSAWADELSAAIDLGAEHMSPYQLTIEPGTAFDRAVGRRLFAPPEDEAAARLFETTQTVLEAAGFDAYEVSNHARGVGARSRHNLVYWTGTDYLGVGPGAHGRVDERPCRRATITSAKPGAYIARVGATGVGVENDEILSDRDAAVERLLLGLRIDAGVTWAQVAALGLTADSAVVAELGEQGLLMVGPERLAATRSGRAVLDGVVRALVQAD
jgi:oxygen-independent coproporphyrinogen-3 oxidase